MLSPDPTPLDDPENHSLLPTPRVLTVPEYEMDMVNLSLREYFLHKQSLHKVTANK